MAAKTTQQGPRTLSLSDFDRITTMSDLEARGDTYRLTELECENREFQNDHGQTEWSLFATFDVFDYDTNEWVGTVSTRGSVARQISRVITRMEAKGESGTAVGPVRVVKGGQNGRSLYFEDAETVPF